jgi:hypothetical protein
LNAIEPLRERLKRATLPELVDHRDHSGEFLTGTFLCLSNRVRFAADW